MLGSQTDDESNATALRIREELARRRLSRQWLADEARGSASTPAGPARTGSLARAEGAAGAPAVATAQTSSSARSSPVSETTRVALMQAV